MFFIDFNKKDITKEFNFHTVEIDVNLPSVEIGLKQLRELVHAQLAADLRPSPNATWYDIKVGIEQNIYVDELSDIDKIDDFFLTLVNTINADLFKQITSAEKRAGEYRLDVPLKLKQYVRASLTTLKEPVNYQTANDIINISITLDSRNTVLGEYHFDLIDQSERREPQSNLIEKGDEADAN